MAVRQIGSDSRIGYQIAVLAPKFLLPVAISSGTVHRLINGCDIGVGAIKISKECAASEAIIVSSFSCPVKSLRDPFLNSRPV